MKNKIFCKDCEHFIIINLSKFNGYRPKKYCSKGLIEKYTPEQMIIGIGISYETKNRNNDCDDFKKKRTLLEKLFGVNKK